RCLPVAVVVGATSRPALAAVAGYPGLVLHFYLDLPRLGSVLLRQGYGQNAVLKAGVDFFSVEGVRDSEAAGKVAVTALHPVITLRIVAAIELALPGDRQGLVLHSYIQVFEFHFRDIGLQYEFVIGLVYIDCGRPGTIGLGLGEETAERVLEVTKTGERIVMAERHGR